MTGQLLRKIITIKNVSMYVLFTLIANITVAVAAPGPAAIVVEESDLSVRYLNMIFGSFGPLAGPQENTIMGDLMMTWNGASLLLGTLLVSYIVLSGILKTAHEGEFLGRQWSSIWVPFRSAIAMSMILPLGTGYSLIQAGAMWFVIQGVGVANLVNSGAMNYMKDSGGIIVVPQPANGINIASNVFKQLMCVETMNSKLEADGFATRVTRFNGDKMYTWGAEDAGLETNACGGMEWGAYDRFKTNAEAFTANGMTVGHMISNISNSDGTAERIHQAQGLAILELENAMRPFVNQYVNEGPGQGVMPSFEQFNAWVSQYNNEMAAQVNAAVGSYTTQMSNLDAVIDGTKKDGWIALGSYFTKITHINDTMANMIDAQASDIAKDLNVPDSYEESVSDNLNAVNKYISDLAKHNLTGLSQVRNDITGRTQVNQLNETLSSIEAGVSSGQNSWLDWGIITNAFSNMSGAAIELMQKDENPITRMQNIGNMIMNVYGTVVTAEAAMNIKSLGLKGALKETIKSSDDDSKKSGAISKALGSFASLGTILLITGIGMAVLMPMIPYLLWTLGVFSWMTSVLIALIATPLWAVAHATPGGDDAMGSGSNGYLLLMSITLRPVLMIFGFYGGMLLLFAIDRLISASFVPAMVMTNSNSMTGPIVAAVSLLIYGVFNMTVIFGTFKLIQRVPDAILQWVGGRDDDVTDVATNSSNTYGIIYGATSTGRQALSSIKGARSAIKPSTAKLTGS